MTAIETNPQVEQAAQAEDISNMEAHTYMLVQFSSNEETRTYVDCKSPYDAMETFCRIYENFLLNKGGMAGEDQEREAEKKDSIEYKLEDILRFIDQLYDLSAMTYNSNAHGFTAHGKAWFKGKVHAYLRK